MTAPAVAPAPVLDPADPFTSHWVLCALVKFIVRDLPADGSDHTDAAWTAVAYLSGLLLLIPGTPGSDRIAHRRALTDWLAAQPTEAELRALWGDR